MTERRRARILDIIEAMASGAATAKAIGDASGIEQRKVYAYLYLLRSRQMAVCSDRQRMPHATGPDPCKWSLTIGDGSR